MKKIVNVFLVGIVLLAISGVVLTLKNGTPEPTTEQRKNDKEQREKYAKEYDTESEYCVNGKKIWVLEREKNIYYRSQPIAITSQIVGECEDK